MPREGKYSTQSHPIRAGVKGGNMARNCSGEGSLLRLGAPLVIHRPEQQETDASPGVFSPNTLVHPMLLPHPALPQPLREGGGIWAMLGMWLAAVPSRVKGRVGGRPAARVGRGPS
jgi:hypothetical protein